MIVYMRIQMPVFRLASSLVVYILGITAPFLPLISFLRPASSGFPSIINTPDDKYSV